MSANYENAHAKSYTDRELEQHSISDQKQSFDCQNGCEYEFGGCPWNCDSSKCVFSDKNGAIRKSKFKGLSKFFASDR